MLGTVAAARGAEMRVSSSFRRTPVTCYISTVRLFGPKQLVGLMVHFEDLRSFNGGHGQAVIIKD